MQNRYVGDIGDYVKYGLLRKLSEGMKLGVAWYLFPDEGHNEDGRHIKYLQEPKKWRLRDPELFDGLNRIVTSGKRNVLEVEKSGLLPDATFSKELLSPGELSISDRREWRKEWFANVLYDLQDCDIVFADPDNGFCEDEKFSYGRIKDWKRLSLLEAKALSRGKVGVFYHHNTRRPGGHDLEVEYWKKQFGSQSIAVRWRAYSARTFFIVNPTREIKRVTMEFSNAWGAELHR